MLLLNLKFELISPRGENERQSENFGGGGGVPAIPILKSVIGTAATQKRPCWNPAVFCCVFAYL